jgi:hypothetical protein
LIADTPANLPKRWPVVHYIVSSYMLPPSLLRLELLPALVGPGIWESTSQRHVLFRSLRSNTSTCSPIDERHPVVESRKSRSPVVPVPSMQFATPMHGSLATCPRLLLDKTHKRLDSAHCLELRDLKLRRNSSWSEITRCFDGIPVETLQINGKRSDYARLM